MLFTCLKSQLISVLMLFPPSGDECLGRFLRLQHLRPERHHRYAPYRPEHVLCHRFQRPRPAAVARGGSIRGRTDPGRKLYHAGLEQARLQTHSGPDAHAGEEHRVEELGLGPLTAATNTKLSQLWICFLIVNIIPVCDNHYHR